MTVLYNDGRGIRREQMKQGVDAMTKNLGDHNQIRQDQNCAELRIPGASNGCGCLKDKSV